jgi:hypothetical protein
MAFPFGISHYCYTYELSLYRGFELIVVLSNNEIWKNYKHPGIVENLAKFRASENHERSDFSVQKLLDQT